MLKKSKKSSNLVEARGGEGKQLRLQNFDGLRVSDGLYECKKVLDDDGADSDYTNFVLGLVSEKMSVDASKNLRERDEEHDYNFYNEEEMQEEDPDFRFVLTHLKPYEKSYVLRYEDNVIKFDEVTSSDTEHDEEQRRKLRSSNKQNGGPSSMVPLLENKGMRESHYASSSKMKSLPFGETSEYEREENGRISTKKKVPRPASVHPTLARRGDSNLDDDLDQERRRMSSGTKHKNGSEFARTKEKERLTRKILQNKPKSKGYSSLDDDSDQERRRMSSGTKQKNGSESARTKEKEKLSRRSIRNTPKSEKEDEIIQMDPDYYYYNKYFKPISDLFAYDPPGHKRIVYELRNGEGNQVKEEPDDGSYSDVEIIDSTEFHKMNKRNDSKYRDSDTTEFRHKVISALKKPFDEEEYRTLWRDIKLHLTKKRHLELRCGRERPFGTQEKGKSYLDHHPVLEKKLVEAEGDEPKRINLLRRFFLWIKQPEGFSPWLDEECLATYPGQDVSLFLNRDLGLLP